MEKGRYPKSCGGMRDALPNLLTTSKFKFYIEIMKFFIHNLQNSHLWLIATFPKHLKRFLVILQPYENSSFLLQMYRLDKKGRDLGD